MKIISDNIKSILALLIVNYSFGLMVLLAFQHSNDKYIISQIIILVSSILTGLAGYYYGYSQGASKKDEAAATAMLTSHITTKTETPAPDPDKK